MPAKDNEQKILIGPDDGARLPVLGITHKVTAEDLGGTLTSIEGRIHPGDMIPPHTHTRGDECAFVLEGELTFDVGGRLVRPQAEGGLPRLLQHGHGGRVLEFHMPGAFENYYDEYERIVQSDMGEDEWLKARTELGERYGVVWHDELIPEFKARFGIGP